MAMAVSRLVLHGAWLAVGAVNHNGAIPAAEVAQHQTASDFWAVVHGSDASPWVVNITGFLQHHPGGMKILDAGLGANFSFAHGKNAHFGATADVFEAATRQFEAQPAPRAPMDVVFWRSRANGGLNREGKPVGVLPESPVGMVTIMGRLAPTARRSGGGTAALKTDDRTTSTIPAFSPGLVEYQGRVAVGKAGHPSNSVSWDWLGSQVSVTLNHSSYLTLKLDTAQMGRKMVRLRCFASFGSTLGTPTLYPLSEVVVLPTISEYAIGAWPGSTGGWKSSEKSTQVTVTIMNDQEWSTGGVVTLLSLSSDGVFVRPVLPNTMATRRLVFVGDSITAGTNLRRPIGDPAYGIPMAPSTPISGIMDDYPLTYQAQLCQAFGANCSTIAYGGKGMFKNCCDEGTTMPEYFQQRLTSEPLSDYRYAFGADGFVPDAVVIALGTNDFAHCRTKPCTADFLAGYVKTYVQFMQNVTRWYGKPEIEFFCGIGPITVNYENSTRAAVQQAVALGLKATLVDMQACARPFPGGATVQGFCNGTATHPGIVGHRRMYEMSYQIIGDKLGWL
jgi:lysophospholipase L1-like esterase